MNKWAYFREKHIVQSSEILDTLRGDYKNALHHFSLCCKDEEFEPLQKFEEYCFVNLDNATAEEIIITAVIDGLVDRINDLAKKGYFKGRIEKEITHRFYEVLGSIAAEQYDYHLRINKWPKEA
ncbi:hypothetical protein HN924_02110 [Candidatus Woesearchaeota archaeon]|jgi:hypothetical protein|nr:hypothetical protein [Candidatus Woesearchaeota archaeon]MBT7062738.1 hypothetical protein [Candidatus Woesearchaeota archaeon]MBT7402983.1 hypothetical protein [Candidatus Woesearchaeota archaeon]